MTNKPMLSVEPLKDRLIEIMQHLTFAVDRNAIREAIALIDKPAAQHQGDPVAWMFRWDYDHGNGWCRNALRFVESMEHVEHEDKSTWRDIAPLFSEQPAPVVTGTTSDKYKAELYDEVWQKARDMGFTNVTDALNKLAAPVAVVMPERKTKADYSGYIEQFQGEAAGLYNSALDDVARLNGVKL